MGTRYNNRDVDFLRDDLYRDTLDDRDVKQIPYFKTARISSVEARLRSTLRRIDHVWTTGDRYYKLAEKHYGNPKLWWVIAWYNTRPTEAHVKVGDLIKIPLPLERVMFYFNSPRT
jgi:nucleoid-associated protein YgaU